MFQNKPTSDNNAFKNIIYNAPKFYILNIIVGETKDIEKVNK